MPTVIVDGHEIEIREGERLNGIQAARRAGIEVPHYCWHPGLSVVGSCRMCLVEVGTRDPKSGAITMLPKVVPACNTPAKDGTVFVTNSEKVQQARAMVEEDLLLRHPVDCPICDKAGECFLQDYYFKYGQNQRRADVHAFTSRRRDLGDNITLFVDRCVMCSRCVRFTREISGTGELMIANRGAHEEIEVMSGFPLANNLSGNVVDLCPVGALCDKDFLYRQRVWFMKRHAGICTGCATGCSIYVDENQDRVYRLRPRENPNVNQWWMCNEGRYSYPHVHSNQRITLPTRRDGKQRVNLDWAGLPAELKTRLQGAGRLAASISPHLTVEEAYLLATVVRAIDPQALLAVGPVPLRGEDEKFANGFTIRAEKCPNRRGVETIVGRFMGRVVTFEELLSEVDRGQVRGAWLSGGYPAAWNDSTMTARFQGLDVVIVQDLFRTPLSECATYELPGAAFPERDGSYVNCDDRLQTVARAIRPPSGVRGEGSLYWEIGGRRGLYHARSVLDDLAREISYFAPAAGAVPDVGVDLKVNLIAEKSATATV